jgi:transposase
LKFVQEGEFFIKQYKGVSEINFIDGDDDYFIKKFYESINKLYLVGPDIVLGKIFNEIGFDKIAEPLFKTLIISRVIYPASKLKTVDYIAKYSGEVIDINKVYRYLDTFTEIKIKRIQQISFEHTRKVAGESLSVVLYDVTNVYYESFNEDDFRKPGFNKDGKHGQPQVVIGLLVNTAGYPLDYEIFEGNKFEGHTMIPIINSFKTKYGLDKIIIVADAGLMSNKNIKDLIVNKFEFIIGARIKNEKIELQKQILALDLSNSKIEELPRADGTRLVMSYTESRCKNDLFNRTKGFNKLKEKVKSGKLTKENINNKGYNKYLKLANEVKVEIDEEKFKEDGKWDGLKGYITNTSLNKQQVIEYYTQLWVVEKAFRIAKTDLLIRPIYHIKKNRILAHISIIFASYKLYKELERQLKLKEATKSVEQTIEILKTIYGLQIILPQSKALKTIILDKTDEQKYILDLFK